MPARRAPSVAARRARSVAAWRASSVPARRVPQRLAGLGRERRSGRQRVEPRPPPATAPQSGSQPALSWLRLPRRDPPSIARPGTASRTPARGPGHPADGGADCRAAPGVAADRSKDGAACGAACGAGERPRGHRGTGRRVVTGRRITARRRIILGDGVSARGRGEARRGKTGEDQAAQFYDFESMGCSPLPLA